MKIVTPLREKPFQLLLIGFYTVLAIVVNADLTRHRYIDSCKWEMECPAVNKTFLDAAQFVL